MNNELAAKFSLDGRRAVIIGAATGIGRQTAITFAQAGAELVLADINVEGLSEVRDAVRPWTSDVRIEQLDVRNRAAVQRLADEAASLGAVDVWANVAGVIAMSPIVDTTEEDLDRIVGINLKGVYWGCAAAARVMMPQGHGSIINISSTGADIPGPTISVYTMTKAAVNMLTRSLAHEVGPSGVRANAVAPGYIDTPLVAYRFRSPDGSIDKEKRNEVFAARAASSVLGRIGQPYDVAMMMLYLASDASEFVTGQVLRPNGGMSMP